MLESEIWLTAMNGDRYGPVSTLESLTASFKANAIGNFSLTAGYDERLLPYLKRDTLVQLWIGPTGYDKVAFVFFLRYWQTTFSKYRTKLQLKGPDLNELLRRRIVAHHTNSAQANMTDFADDMMKEIFDDAFADGTNPAPTYGSRVISNLSSYQQEGKGPSITKAFAYDRLLETNGGGVLPEIAQRAYQEDGTEVFFEIRPIISSDGSVQFVFYTAINQLRQDRSATLVFDENSPNLSQAAVTYDYRTEENYIYGTGKGIEDEREIVQVYTEADVDASDYNRCEGVTNRSNLEGTALTTAATEQLEKNRGKIAMTGSIISTPYSVFGKDWRFGDRVKLQVGPYQGTAHIAAGTINIQARGTTVNAKLVGRL